MSNFNKRTIGHILSNPTYLLALGYALGQGVTFCSQLLIKNYGGNELLGSAVVLISMYSLCFQFAEFGNTTFVIHSIDAARRNKLLNFLFLRAIVGFIVGAALVLMVSEIDLILKISVPFAALFYGLSMMGVVEGAGNYRKMVLMQATLWCVHGLLILLLIINNDITLYVFSITLVIAGFLYYKITRISEYTYAYTSKVTRFDLVNLIAHVGPPLVGQLVGRLVLFSIGGVYGLASVGLFGLAKYFQVALSLLFSFWLRPKNREMAVRNDRNNYTYKELLGIYRWQIVASIIAPIVVYGASYISNALDWFGADGWLFMIFVIPFWVVGGIFTQNLARLKISRQYAYVEYSCLSINVVVFLSLLKNNPVLAVIAGEVSQNVLAIISSAWLAKRYGSRPL